ncbi:MAG TPA: FlgD immunoglobulin-like domain containing protein, partial [Bacteroidota bacterium]|nr:FlgD immunoglobulin-like domain containing protein [Bacteroidota bacterium]
IYNSLGEVVKTLVNDVQSAGTYNVVWNGTNNTGVSVSSGMYFFRITASGNQSFTSVKKMLLMK